MSDEVNPQLQEEDMFNSLTINERLVYTLRAISSTAIYSNSKRQATAAGAAKIKRFVPSEPLLVAALLLFTLSPFR